MQRLILVTIAAIALAALIQALLRGIARRIEAHTSATETENMASEPMAKIAFFLLLCVMAYAIAMGAS